MIIDTIENADKYIGLSNRFAAGIQHLQSGAWKELPVGIHQLHGDGVVLQVQAYDSFPQSAVNWEAHHNYCDIQYVVDGEERMGYGKLSDFTISVPYDDQNDVYFLEEKGQSSGQFTRVPAGSFTIFMPQDVHMPRVAIDDQPSPIKKLVYKIKI
ncbi:MAG: YhcH/YjgK/YiaL family protein [Chloroflexota bacterium]